MDRREALKTAGGLAIMVGCPTASVSMAMAEPPPYDPVAVLEAMREAGFEAQLCIQQNPGGSLWESVWLDRPTRMDYNRETFPDFPSAVRWLHEQAAAVDAEFAAMWPVPAEVKQDG